jgi:hypothetical protein
MFRPRIAALALLALSSSLWGQTPGIRVIQDMNFGELIVEEQGGGIALTPEGILVPYGMAVQATGRSPVQEVRFALTGPPKARFRVALNPPTPQLTEPRGSRIRIESFQYSAAGNEGAFDIQGQATLRVGAKLDIPAGASAGTYVTRQVNLQLTLLDGDGARNINQEFTISAKIRPTLRLVNLASLDFGSLIPGPVAGRYFVMAGGGTRGEAAGGPRQFKGNPHPAEFLISGSMGACYSIELPKRVMLTGPGTSLEIQDFHCNVPLQAIVPAGGLRFQVGASLLIPSNKEPGLYQGVFMVSVDYP